MRRIFEIHHVAFYAAPFQLLINLALGIATVGMGRRDVIWADFRAPAPDRDEPWLFRPRPSCRAVVVVQLPKASACNVGAPRF